MCCKTVNATDALSRSGAVAHLFNEVVEGLAYALEKQVMPCKATSVLLEQVQADGQDAAQHVGQAATQLTSRRCGSAARGTANTLVRRQCANQKHLSAMHKAGV
jgi:hypothetical protein